MKKISKLLKQNWILILIIILSASLRFYKLPAMASYDYDQEYVSTFVLEVTRIYPIKLNGQGLSVMGLFMGPFYFYAMVPFYLLFGLNPLGGFVGSILLGILTVLSYYLITKSIFSSKSAGLISAFIRAIGFYAISSDWMMVPSDSSDLAIILVWYLLFRIWKNKKIVKNFKERNFWLLPSLFFIFGMFTSFHPIHFPIILVFIVLIILWKKTFTIFNWVISLVAGIIPVLPIILFDYLRKWTMTKQVIGMFTGGDAGSTGEIIDLNRFIYILESASLQWQNIFTIYRHNQIISILTFIPIWFWIIWQLKKRFKLSFSFHVTSLVTLLLVIIGYYSIFPTHIPEYYLRSLQAVSVLYLGFGLSVLLKNYSKPSKIIFFTLLSTLIYLNLGKLLVVWNYPKHIKLVNKQAVVKHIIEQANGKPFRISYVTELGFQFGFNSLFEIYGITPGDKGAIYTIVSPTHFISNPSELEFVSGGVGVNYPD